MRGVPSHLRLLAMQLRTSVLVAMQYRVDFILDAVVEVVWASTAIVPLFVVYGSRESIAGWRFHEALLVVGWFTMLQGILEGAINPSLQAVVEHVRRGTLDFLLLKPIDLQFLLSTSRFSPWKCTNVLTALVIFGYAFAGLGRAPSALELSTAALLFAAALVIFYSITLLSVSLSFYVVRIDNLTYLFTSLFDLARWPTSVFSGVWRFFFTFVVPLGLMTTFPAEAMLGRMPAGRIVVALAVAFAFGAASRIVFRRALRHYSSASS